MKQPKFREQKIWEPKTELISFRVGKRRRKKLETLAKECGISLARFMDEIVCEALLEGKKK